MSGRAHLRPISMHSYFVYILRCFDGLTYTGITNDLPRRLEEHQKGRKPKSFTFKRRPIELIFHQKFNDVFQGIRFEKKIKRRSGKKN